MNKEILRLAIPNILTNLTIPMVSLVDIALVGRMPTTEYIIAIGLGTVIFNFIYWGFGFLRMGTTGMVAQEFGRKDFDAANQLLVKGVLIALAAGLLLILFKSYIFDLCLYYLHPTGATLDGLKSYFQIRIYAAPATIIIYVLTGWFLGMQDSKSALILALLINGTNALVSYGLVKHFHLNIQGIAIGTLIAQYLGLSIGLLLLALKYKFRLNQLRLILSNSSSWSTFFITNTNIFIRTFCLILVMSFFKATAAGMELEIGAANILLIEFITIGAYGIDGFAFAAESICGKYFGKGNLIQFKKSVKLIFVWGMSFGCLITMLFTFFGEEILSMLTNKSNIIQTALLYLPWLIISPILNSFAFVWDGIYVGTTSSKQMRNTMFIATLLYFLVVHSLQNQLGNHGIWLAFTLFMMSRGILQTVLYRKAILCRIS